MHLKTYEKKYRIDCIIHLCAHIHNSYYIPIHINAQMKCPYFPRSTVLGEKCHHRNKKLEFLRDNKLP